MKPMSIRELERELLSIFPKSLAADWDKVGLILGNADEDVAKIAIALDPTVEAVESAAAQHCNVLLSHHPVFLNPPSRFVDSSDPGQFSDFANDDFAQMQAARICMRAAKAGVSLIALHTNLDFSPRSQRILADILGISYLEAAIPNADGGGFGQICSCEASSLGELAARCHERLGSVPRVWGSLDGCVKRICLGPGSGGGLIHRALESSCDCLICGEIRYHSALAAKQSGLGIIELGHDVSEEPFTQLLRESLEEIGFASDEIVMLEKEEKWQSVLLLQEIQEDSYDA